MKDKSHIPVPVIHAFAITRKELDKELDHAHERMSNLGMNTGLLFKKVDRIRQGAAFTYWLTCTSFTLVTVLLVTFILK